MFGHDVIVIKLLGFLLRQSEDLLDARRVGNVADHLRLGAGGDLLLDFHADGLKFETHLLENVDSDTLPELDQAK